MKWKPNETDIIDYLFGELRPDNQKKFEAYMTENADFAQEVKDLRLTQKVLPALTDEEVIPHIPLIESQQRNPMRNQMHRWFLPISIAASIAALLVVGYLTQFNLSYTDAGFKMSFNNSVAEPLEKLLTKAEVQEMINASTSLTSKGFENKLDEVQLSFATQLEQNNRLTKANIQRVASRQVKLDDEQILTFIAQLNEENKKNIQSFYQASASQQKKYMQIMLQDFNEYLTQQRVNDLNSIQLTMKEIQNESFEQQQETDKILASIITTVNSRSSVGL